VLDDTRPTKRPSSGGGSTLAGAGIAEVSSLQMNLLLNLKIIHLSKNAYLFTTPAVADGSFDKFPPNAGESADAAKPSRWLRFG
jgi:hypothetical protein